MSGSVILLKKLRPCKLIYKTNNFSRILSTTKTYDNKESRWQAFYENYIRFPDLKSAQEKVLKVEEEYLNYQKEKNQCWNLLLAAQSQLKDIHAKLDPLSTVDNHYPQLLAEEVESLKKIRSLSLDYSIYDKSDKEKLAFLSQAITDCLNTEKDCERRIFKLLLIAVLSGFMLSFIITYVSYKLYLYSSLERVKENVTTLKGIVLDLSSYIKTQNNKVKSYLEDIWKLIGFEKMFPQEENLLPPSVEEEDKLFIEKSHQFYKLSNSETESALHEMLKIEDALKFKQEFQNLPTLIVEDEKEKISDKGLWVTTFGYGSAAILVPLALLMFA